MVKKILANTFLLCIIYITGFAQKKSIKYIFSDAVEIKLDSIANSFVKAGKDIRIYLVLQKNATGYTISVCHYKKSEKNNIPKAVKITNRYAIINDRLIPVIFDYDFFFSSPSKDISVFKNRDDQIVRSSFLNHGPVLTINSKGNFIRIE